MWATKQETIFKYLQSSQSTYFFFKILFIFRERGREGEGEENKHRCHVPEKQISCLSHAPNQGLGLQLRHVPWPEIKHMTLQFTDADAKSTEPHQPGLKVSILKATTTLIDSSLLDNMLFASSDYSQRRINRIMSFWIFWQASEAVSFKLTWRS